MPETTATLTHPGAGPGASGARRYHLAQEPHVANGTALGFWLYLMSDILIFAALFATYGVLGRAYAGGPTGAELFDLKLVALNTAFLLLSSFTFGLAMLHKQARQVGGTLAWLGVTGLLGLAFLAVELYEFAHLIAQGATPQRSAFLSAFFALVGTHGLHVAFGLVWLVTLMLQVHRHGLIPANVRRVDCLSMFWHFLDLVWVGVFTFVYLMGVL
ncbi:cytochrome o ubiquinol oxidase subunit III [Melaminivora alkalimesophila]|uniref:Cytochrome bo(3) ubiquinol oxidase subunit 3 n=1 Tax=Melaminivora alkalimesophila TaxID=1165852 RepID=A0A317RIR8_9BURK|nr:cytochrome o ubiquinol oxidase subunit III [Melaminivora alkalimesophila]PWW48966.1 cytochrome bo3 quinol oxidase subunit 3 [Melaminivora alkalimesophila]